MNKHKQSNNNKIIIISIFIFKKNNHLKNSQIYLGNISNMLNIFQIFFVKVKILNIFQIFLIFTLLLDISLG